MAVQVSYPGVYIEEFTPGAPIQGVGTNTAAFIGPAAAGDLDRPTKLTSWDQFLATFGRHPLPGFSLWYAVRGFFENGGRVCYIVRASNGTYQELNLEDGQGNPAIHVRARQPGNATPAIAITVATTHVLTTGNTTLYRPQTTVSSASGRDITVFDAAEAAQFRPGDSLDIGGQPASLSQVSANVLRLVVAPSPAPIAGTAVRLANAPASVQIVRIQSSSPIAPGSLVPGTMLTITQAGNSVSQIVAAVHAEPLQTAPPITTYRVTLRDALGMSLDLDPAGPVGTVQSEEFSLTVTQGAVPTVYDNLAMDAAHPRYFLDYVNSRDRLITLELIEPTPLAFPPDNLPAVIGPVLLGLADPEDLATLADQDYLDALDMLRQVDDVNLIAIPDGRTAHVQQELIAHCELMQDRFAVLDARPGLQPFGATGSIEAQRLEVPSTRGYAALYYPWLRVPPDGIGPLVLVPPSGHVCGIIARSDNNRGVHKAPANEYVNGALAVESIGLLGDIAHGQLNLQGVNVIRIFQGGGRPMLYGARTLATDLNWQYVNIRRLFLFLEESIAEGIQWAVFEPNNLQLWQKLKRTITEFLTRVWRDGGLFGAKAEEAFYVRIDEVLNPFSEQARGRLHIEIGVRPTYPAEFIIVRIGIWPGGSEISEG